MIECRVPHEHGQETSQRAANMTRPKGTDCRNPNGAERAGDIGSNRPCPDVGKRRYEPDRVHSVEHVLPCLDLWTKVCYTMGNENGWENGEYG